MSFSPERAFNPFAGRQVEDVELSERQIELSKRWSARRLTREALKSRGVAIDPTEAGKLFDKKQQRDAKSIFKFSEEGAMAEVMLLEGADEEGKKTKGSAARWFGEYVYAYPANEIDDNLRGVDAILMCMDEEDERTAHPLAVDVKTNAEDFDRVLLEEFGRFMQPKGREVYWADTALPSGTSSFDAPAPGKINAVKLLAYIPHTTAAEYRANATPEKRATQIIQNMGPYMRKQFQVQLEVEALLLLNKIQLDHLTRPGYSFQRGIDRSKLLAELAATVGSNSFRERCATLHAGLQRIWQTQDEQGDAELQMIESNFPQSIQHLELMLRPRK